MQTSRFVGRCLAAWLAWTGGAALAGEADFVAGKLTIFNDNGGWCWFQGERALIHDGKLFFGSVANEAGPGGTARDGNIEVTAYDLATGKSQVFVLHERLENDDHDGPDGPTRLSGFIVSTFSNHAIVPLAFRHVVLSPRGEAVAQEHRTQLLLCYIGIKLCRKTAH